jgi:uncharacterized protein YdeI (YjbR/CyaY-like superfamily)
VQEIKPTAFRAQKDFAAWLRTNHASTTELCIRLFKVHAKHRGIGYREALDESLCWGWIDGVRHAFDADSFTVRFTPRKPKSIWSAVNIKRFKELLAAKRVRPPGLAAFKRWSRKKAPYSFENRPKKLSPTYLKQLRANPVAWAFFRAQAPWYQRIIAHFVMSAKRQETRDSRAAAVLKWHARGKRIPELARDR